LWEVVTALEGDCHLNTVVTENKQTHETHRYDVDALVVNIGFKTNLGPLKSWGLNIEKNKVVVYRERIVYRDRPVYYEAEPRSYEQPAAYGGGGNRLLGQTLGAIAGGALGTQVGQGNGRIAATAIGAVVGGALGGHAAGY
jgi:hypothetical protein